MCSSLNVEHFPLTHGCPTTLPTHDGCKLVTWKMQRARGNLCTCVMRGGSWLDMSLSYVCTETRSSDVLANVAAPYQGNVWCARQRRNWTVWQEHVIVRREGRDVKDTGREDRKETIARGNSTGLFHYWSLTRINCGLSACDWQD
jgi:hypothetical protein